ncbi:unnamed protein product [Arabidopsis halleri]
MDPDDPNYAKRVFWEFDTAPIADRNEASSIFDKITASLKQANPRYFIRMVTIYVDFSAFQEDTSIFQKGNHNFDLIVAHMPKRDPYYRDQACKDGKPPKDLLASHCLKQDLNFHTIYDDPPFNVLVITSDPAFEATITELYQSGFVMLLACDTRTLSTVGRHCYYKWYWNQMRMEAAPLLPDGTFLA